MNTETKTDNTMPLYIPFAGFYESLYNAEIDDNIERVCEHWECEYEDLKINHRAIREAIAYEYARKFFEQIEKETYGDIPTSDIELKPDDVTLHSPRWYNFETDGIMVRVPKEFIRLLSGVANEKDLRETIRERHTSYDGFYSHYSNELEDWPVSVYDWDAVQCETLLIAALKSLDVDLDELEDTVFSKLIDLNVISEAVCTNTERNES